MHHSNAAGVAAVADGMVLLPLQNKGGMQTPADAVVGRIEEQRRSFVAHFVVELDAKRELCLI